ncbi:UDP-N-acetylmuramate--L-alanine ligase [Allonocardiopsis opalescens]|uniref:UDP-N-acetylmuramate--L-alanine ligase n=1 Tax=Allonocardiopsis opalescens TaxID=1144618 RepID=A0A2T0Q3V5_9ACTN|nr:UDP-N-acetylmuramate--L-alanine ligase [Allonocardiopsis opalescens]PRX98489.1 UDP-N-acetylmuramate--L-alanine ligase [Allonocardiopsis opalescens]
MSLVEPVEPVPVEELGRVHFIGIGGAGMSGIARVLLQRGVAVSGSDARDSSVLTELRAAGARVHAGHAAEQLGEADTVVVSSAVRPGNPELAAARERGLRVLPRAAALGALLLGRRGIAVAGTHGKTTTTSMLATVLRHCGAEPGYVIGGKLVGGPGAPASGLAAAADAGSGELIVVEADESDGSFLMLRPEIAVVTNVEADHLDNYSGIEQIHEGFDRFTALTGELVVAGVDDPGAQLVAKAAAEHGRQVRGYGENPGADYRIGAIAPAGFGSRFTLAGPAGEHPYTVHAPGRHNVANAAAAIAVALELGFAPGAAAAGLAAYRGTARRFEPKGEARGVRVYDSYAHHPTELAADLRAARAALDSEPPRGEGAAPGRVIALFQPHLYSRTRIFAAEFGQALGLADEVVVMSIYAAREDPEPGVGSELVTSAVPHGRVHLQPERERIPAQIAALARPGDIVLTMGAGDVTELGPRIVDALGS